MMPDGQSRKDADEQTPPSSIKINKSLRIGSWNVRTMYEVGKQEQIRNEMQRYNLNILGISETHWSQSGQRKLKTGELILYSGEEELHRRGVAMKVRPSGGGRLMDQELSLHHSLPKSDLTSTLFKYMLLLMMPLLKKRTIFTPGSKRSWTSYLLEM